MTWATRCAVVIPCFNEERTISGLIELVRQRIPTALVVDDGSTDGTAAQARWSGATVVQHDRNRGKGAALKTGLSLAREQGFEWAFTLDGDGQHSPEDMPRFLSRAEATGARLIVGNRMPNAQEMPWLRRQVNRWMSAQISRRAGLELPDTQCGFRLIHLGSWATLPLTRTHFEVESETLVLFVRAGHQVEFVPITVIGGRRASRVAPVADTVRWWRWWRSLGPGK